MKRFAREAEVLASLNHPNIAAIYGLEDRALVLELVEGHTLADRIARGPIPLDEAVAIAKQIVEALEAAHERGIIHRDIKPANVKVREDGTVKVLDFGLAKALDDEREGDASESPTMTAAATRAGVIMGTAAYMSPEQARGKRVDRRADIWAFGAVLFEMLTGRLAFEAEDVSLTLAEVMTSEPRWDALPPCVPPTLRVYLARCLHKDPNERVRDIGDVGLALDGAFDAPDGVEVSRPGPRTSIWVAALALTALVAAFATFVVSRPSPPSVLRVNIASPASSVVGSAPQQRGARPRRGSRRSLDRLWRRRRRSAPPIPRPIRVDAAELRRAPESVHLAGRYETRGPDGTARHRVRHRRAGSGRRRELRAHHRRSRRPMASPDLAQWEVARLYVVRVWTVRKIYVRPYPDVDRGRWQVWTAGGSYPMWSPSPLEDELFYRTETQVFAVPVSTRDGFEFGQPEVLFEGRYAFSDPREYDVSPDGEKFLMIKVSPEDETERGDIHVVLNWFEELRELN